MKLFIYKQVRTALILVGIALMAACDKYVQVDLPASQLTGQAVFKEKATANAALVEVYSKMRENGFLSANIPGATTAMGLYADELDFYGPPSEPANFYYQNGILTSDVNVSQLWNTTYQQIYGANAVLEGLQNSPIAEADRNQFRAEALFIRSILHFYLISTFGDVPLVTTTNYETNRSAIRTSTLKIYEQIVNDLKEASALTQQTYYTAGRVRPNRATVNALLAKIYLYRGLWNEAADAASAVLNQGDYSLNVPIADVFLKGSPSTIWQFNPRIEGTNTNFAITFIFTSGPPPYVALTNKFVSAFESGDRRRTSWVGTVTNGGSSWYYPAKYDQNNLTSSSLEFPIVFRIQEQYLIRAEARARSGQILAAKADLDAIRTVAGLGATTAATEQEVLDAILKERRVELFTEYGNRFYDLKRNGNLDGVLNATKPGWNATDALWPIPDTELRANTNLKPQNPGY